MYAKYFVLFAMMATGYLMRRIRIINDAMNDGLNKFIVYFAYPCLLVLNIGKLRLGSAMLFRFLLMTALTCGLFVLYAAASRLYAAARRFPKRISNVAELAMSSPNDGFMGFPVAQIFFGPEGLLLMMAHNVGLNVYLFSYGLIALRRNNKEKPRTTVRSVMTRVVKILINPNLLAVYLGFLISLLHVPLDNAMGDYLDYMGNVATPMAMVYIGSSLVGTRFTIVLRNRIVWGSSMMKLAVLPLKAAAVWFLPIPALMKAALVLGGCFPTAATVCMLAQQEHQNEKIAGRILFFSTVLSMGTIPLAVKLLQTGLGLS